MSNRETLSSIKDPRIGNARLLTSSAGRKKAGRCLLEGAQAITWAYNAGIKIEEVFWELTHEDQELAELLRGIPQYTVSSGIAKKITNTSYLVPVIGVAHLPEQHKPVGNFILLLDNLQDHGNIGTIFRTASAFGIKEVAFTHDADPYFKKTIDASRGTIFRSRVYNYTSVKEAIAYLKQHYQLVATSPYGKNLQSLAPLAEKPIALVLGNETDGIQQELLEAADLVVQLPMSSHIESLNVAVCAGLSMYELKLRMILTMLTSYIATTLGRQVNVTGKLIQQAFDVALRQVTTLSATQVILLMIMTLDKTMSAEQIIQDTGTLNLEKLLAPLLTQGLIIRDGAYAISNKGKDTLAKLWPVVEATEEKLLVGFSEEERQHFMAFLERIQDNCVRITQPK